MDARNQRAGRIVGATLLLALLQLPGGEASAELDRYVQIYVGRYSPVTFREIPFSRWNLQDEYLVSLGVGKELRRFWDNLGLEAEGQVVGHWGDSGSYMEFVAAITLRWHRFPWNEYIRTTIGFSEGLSYVTMISDHERNGEDEPGARLLNYLMYEVDLAHPGWERTSFFFRVHHRSGVFGLFHGVYGASNYPSVGVRYRF
jgi:hypothetical protein